jgi:hypothetical protein
MWLPPIYELMTTREWPKPPVLTFPASSCLLRSFDHTWLAVFLEDLGEQSLITHEELQKISHHHGCPLHQCFSECQCPSTQRPWG